ncbi:hypothetical protein L596_025820 [Steinernema carpocapsae]|uniref:Uncharacterized protein n=1 Tax=Steinernema carpocapsae TaxID=34508 RepID=A0A4U5M905_STECR|nr:hypothetical protein L596_025820 [Steinernema carpocapsae]
MIALLIFLVALVSLSSAVDEDGYTYETRPRFLTQEVRSLYKWSIAHKKSMLDVLDNVYQYGKDPWALWPMPEAYPLAQSAWFSVRKIMNKETLKWYYANSVSDKRTPNQLVEIYDVPAKYRLGYMIFLFTELEARGSI